MSAMIAASAAFETMRTFLFENRSAREPACMDTRR